MGRMPGAGKPRTLSLHIHPGLAERFEVDRRYAHCLTVGRDPGDRQTIASVRIIRPVEGETERPSFREFRIFSLPQSGPWQSCSIERRADPAATRDVPVADCSRSDRRAGLNGFRCRTKGISAFKVDFEDNWTSRSGRPALIDTG